MSSIWTKITVYGDGTIKLPPELVKQLGLAQGEGGALYVAKAEVTKNQAPTGAPAIMVVSAEELMKIAPEELEQPG